MIQKLVVFYSILLITCSCGDSIKKKEYKSPDSAYPELFKDVQLSFVFKDSKTFCDAIPKIKAEDIEKIYKEEKTKPGFKLSKFVNEYFKIETKNQVMFKTDSNNTIEEHIDKLWSLLSKRPKDEGGSLIPLRKPYIVSGGSFNELYYWDSYFSMIGLQVSKKDSSIENMVVNFAQLIEDYGHIPTANRSYYLSRSQPPYFGLMVELLSETKKDPTIYTKYLNQMQKDYQYWMSAEDTESLENQIKAKKEGKKAFRKVVFINENLAINRYYDALNSLRPEAYKEDLEISKKTKNKQIFRELRSAAESGWGMSTRWLQDKKQIKSINISQIAPIDLNCLLYKYELILSKAYAIKGQKEYSKSFNILAQKRKDVIQKYFWDEEQGFYFDYNFETKQATKKFTLAGMYPLFVGLATDQQAQKVAKVLETKFLMEGGLQTTLENTGQEWDAPYGWAPLQWISYAGLKKYNQTILASEVKKRWIANNLKIFKTTGKFVEKYDVVTINKANGGGKYASQDGFAWTNGVLIKMLSEK
jgi:alpha,alpha-trehalase